LSPKKEVNFDLKQMTPPASKVEDKKIKLDPSSAMLKGFESQKVFNENDLTIARQQSYLPSPENYKKRKTIVTKDEEDDKSKATLGDSPVGKR
jgi:hypothetical protein